MFATSYNNSPLVGAAANEIFPNIHDDTKNLTDVSILTTMRVLLYDRLKDGQKATLVQREVLPSFMDGDLETCLKAVFPEYSLSEAENTLFIVNVPASSEEEKKNLIGKFKGVKSILGMNSGEIFEKGLFNSVMKSKIYLNKDRSCTLIFVAGSITNVASHAIALMVPRYFDRFFDHGADNHVIFTENEKMLVVNGLAIDQRSDSFISAVQIFAERFDFRTPEIKAKLSGFEKSYARGRAEALDRQIEESIMKINDINEQYARALRQKRSLLEKRTAIMLGLEEDKEEDALMNYFLINKNLSLVSVDNGVLNFYVKTPLGNFDSELVKRILERPDREDRCNIYSYNSGAATRAERDLLFKAIFVDETIRVWLFGFFTMKCNDQMSVQADNGFSQPPEMHDCCPNPHLFRHACMGDNQRYANDAMANGDFVLAMEQTIGSVASVNINEGVTAGPWMDNLLSDKYGRFFETKDGRRMNFTEVKAYLKGEN